MLEHAHGLRLGLCKGKRILEHEPSAIALPLRRTPMQPTEACHCRRENTSRRWHRSHPKFASLHHLPGWVGALA